MSDISSLVFSWLLYVVILPLVPATLIALPIWLKRKVVFGNVVGSCVIAAVIFVLIWQQYGAYVQAQTACSQSSIGCSGAVDSPYTQYLLMVLIGWVDVFFLLVISGIVEDRQKRRRLDRSKL